MPKLVVLLEEGDVGYELKEGQNLIGRLPRCAVPISHPTASGRHAAICGQGGDFVLEDLGSRNGTFVNQQRIAGRVKLNHNDLICFGEVRARFLDSVHGQAARGSALATVSELEAEGDPIAGHVDIHDRCTATITGELLTPGRYGGLEVNPAAKLKAVLEISNSLAGTLDLASLLPKILESLFSIFPYADRGCILLKDAQTGSIVPRAMRHRRGDEDSTVRVSRTIVGKVLSEKAGVLSADASADDVFRASQSIADLGIRSMMCVPLLGLDGEAIGVLSIDSQSPLGQFTCDDLGILMAVAGQAALAYENARLMQAYADKRKHDAELELARRVQHAILPSTLATAEGYQFYASYDAAQVVGGDIYDCLRLPEGKICLSFGDVAGKGVPGALVMSRLSSYVESTVHHVPDVVEAMTAINKHLCNRRLDYRFVTFILCMVDTRNHEVVLSNAGHRAPLIRRANRSIERFDQRRAGPPIGIKEDYPYEAETRKLEPGDMVILTTDGVEEALNAEGTFYGTDRASEVVRHGPDEAEALGKALLADVRRHARDCPQSDDISIMVFGRSL